MTRSYLLLLPSILTVFLLGCGEKPTAPVDTPEETVPSATLSEEVQQEASPKERMNTGTRQEAHSTLTDQKPPRTSTFTKLQGTWQSIQDPKSRIQFDRTTLISIYDGEELSQEPFKLAANCDDERMPYSEVKVLYILSDELCWSINSVTASFLELTYISRGNTLTYKKVVAKEKS